MKPMIASTRVATAHTTSSKWKYRDELELPLARSGVDVYSSGRSSAGGSHGSSAGVAQATHDASDSIVCGETTTVRFRPA